MMDQSCAFSEVFWQSNMTQMHRSGGPFHREGWEEEEKEEEEEEEKRKMMMMMMVMVMAMVMMMMIIIIIRTNPTISIVKQYYWNKNMKTTHLCVFLVIKNYK